jgi:hypothetical protein
MRKDKRIKQLGSDELQWDNSPAAQLPPGFY